MKTAQLRLKLPGWSKAGMIAVILCCLQQMNSHLKHIFYALPGICLVLLGVYWLRTLKVSTKQAEIIAASRVEKPVPVFTDTIERGQIVFKKHCLMCHTIFKDGYVHLPQAIDNEHWTDRRELFRWLQDPSYYMKNEPYGKDLYERYGSVCLQPTPRLNWEQMEEIIAYLRYCRGKTSFE
ncbi:MAG: cytochrome c [Sphingobacteriales bacterium]|nr:cytochrome c [Sphingobacteriales bacterium]OJW30703.1 MAG: hypothetical protein BGO54_22535 [Sphingobacteriales bacterium 46-32]